MDRGVGEGFGTERKSGRATLGGVDRPEPVYKRYADW